MKPSLSSLYQAVEIPQEPRPLLIGERCNANGSRRFRECLLADDFEGCLKIALAQETSGAHVLDLCTAYAGRDEMSDLTRLVRAFAQSVRLPLVIDSTTPDCIEACLRLYPGRCLVNSINLEDGGDTLNRVCPLIRRYGAAAIALTINREGMAMTAQDKLETAQAIHALAVDRHGLRPSDLVFDPLTFTIGSGDESLLDAAAQTIAGIRLIKRELPGVFTVLGVSNVSFGLPPRARRVLNSVFLHEAVAAGLDAAIIDAAKVLPLNTVPDEDVARCLDLVYDRRAGEEQAPLMRFIAHFQDGEEQTGTPEQDESGPSEQALHDRVVRGDAEDLEDLLTILRRRYTPTAIINTVLVPAMRHVGELFGRGELLLPFVLQSAEVMKRAVRHLDQFMDKSEEKKGTTVLLATVRGDVHDIGKNLVDIILSNNGYRVHNLGIKVPAETIISKARELGADIIGLSGLLVKSAIVMQESMPQYRDAGLAAPILLGGAALTRRFVAESCVPGYDRPVVYCADAFAGLKAVREHEAGKLASTTCETETARAKPRAAMAAADVERLTEVPTPPFTGARCVSDIHPDELFPYVNEQALFRGRWGYRRGKLGADDYRRLIDDEVLPHYASLKERAVSERLIQPRVAYGYFPCFRSGDAVEVCDGDRSWTFAFPRRDEPPHLCISDYFRTREEGGDVAAFFVVTIGERMAEATRALFEDDAYRDYLLLHGFGVEVTDALAEYWHETMRRELGIDAARPSDPSGYVTQEYRGSRYGFGYPACPDLDAHQPLFEMLQPERIGVTLTENMEMVPEQSTSAIVAHHPQAKYFAV